MATSGSIDFNRTRNEIINAAMRKARVKSRGQNLSAEALTEASEALNILVKRWATSGCHLWCRKEGVVFLTAAQESYLLGTGGDRATSSYVQTALNGDHIATDTTLVVDSTTGMTANDVVGIELADGTMHWTTISVVSSSTGITIASGLASAASDDAVIFTYTTIIERPRKILYDTARWRSKTGTETPLAPGEFSRADYMQLSNKSTSGKISQIHYDPQLTTGKLFVWPTADDVTDVLKFTFQRTLEDFDAAGNNPDFPVEWMAALIWGLAADLGPEYGVPLDRQSYLDNKAAFFLNEAMGFDDEETSVFMMPDLS